jgi:hypothetical protein
MTLLERRLRGPQCQSGTRGEEKSLASAGDRTPAVQLVTCRYCINEWPPTFTPLPMIPRIDTRWQKFVSPLNG